MALADVGNSLWQSHHVFTARPELHCAALLGRTGEHAHGASGCTINYLERTSTLFKPVCTKLS